MDLLLFILCNVDYQLRTANAHSKAKLAILHLQPHCHFYFSMLHTFVKVDRHMM